MRIPSYDDLTPSIPDVGPDEVLTSAAAVLPQGGPIASRQAPSSGPPCALYAALHGGAVDRLAAIADDFSPRIERSPGGTVVLDVSGLQRLLGTPAAIAADLVQAGAPRVAVAVSQIAAVLLARAQAGATVAIGEPETALREVPLGVLEQWTLDVDAAAIAARPSSLSSTSGAAAQASRVRLFEVLRRWGLSTIGELAALPAANLSARLGPAGVAAQRLARGLDPRPLIPDPGVRRFVESCQLEWPIETLEPLSFVFARLLDPLAAALEQADRGAVALHLALRLTDRTTHVRVLQLPAPMRDPRVLRTLLLLDLESHPPAAAIDIVSIEIDPAPGRVVQYSLLERAVPSPETMATLMARLGALVGESRCGSPVLLDTHRPDGFVMGPVAFRESRSRTSNHSEHTVALRAHDDATGRRHDEIKYEDNAASCRRAVVPSCDAQQFVPRPCSSKPSALRRFRPPIAVRVAVESGRPVRVAIDRQRMPGGTVLQAAGPWRTSGGWWDPVRWNRDEWDVALGDGAVCRLYHDRDSDQWFLEGVFD